jgi:hypothetical protein
MGPLASPVPRFLRVRVKVARSPGRRAAGLAALARKRLGSKMPEASTRA